MKSSLHDELARTFNFRDLGGLKTADGGEVRRGILYRSASLSELNPAQLDAIRALEIHWVIDFRVNHERATHPTPWREFGGRQYWFRDHGRPAGGDLNSLLADEQRTHEINRNMMMRAYRDLPYQYTEALHRLFVTVAAEDGAVLFHCTSGKDRTGIAAALMLSALGVPRDTITHDYLRTTEFDILASPAFRQDPPFSPARQEDLRPIFSVYPEYLENMFDAITARDGSVDKFLRQTLALSDSELGSFRARLLG
jgi:protein-tyrosine phosphatase